MITDDNQLLFFIRKFFDKLSFDQCAVKDRKGWLFIGKPIVLCITCIASFWGVIVFVFLNGFCINIIPYIVFNSIAASFIQTFIWKYYSKF